MTNRIRHPIKKLLIEHYHGKSLNNDQLAELFEMQALADCKKTVSLSRRIYSIARDAARLAIVIGVLVLGLGSGGLNFQGRIGSDLVEEIAFNHRQPTVLEIDTASLDDVAAQLDRLPFSLVESRRFESQRWTLLGARYCSLSGQLAAQLKLLDKHSQSIVTVYQSAIPIEQAAYLSEQTSKSSDGVEVSVWWEGDVMMALARAPSGTP